VIICHRSLLGQVLLATLAFSSAAVAQAAATKPEVLVVDAAAPAHPPGTGPGAARQARVTGRRHLPVSGAHIAVSTPLPHGLICELHTNPSLKHRHAHGIGREQVRCGGKTIVFTLRG